MVEDAEAAAGRTVQEMTLTFHEMGLYVYGEAAPSNAPEGIHQDGADYIVSALVLEREDVVGGESVVLAPDKKSEYLRVALAPGQGIFHADAHRGLRPDQQPWHGITPIRLHDTNGDGEGFRNIFGFDITLGQSPT